MATDSAHFLQELLRQLPEDPTGAELCLILLAAQRDRHAAIDRAVARYFDTRDAATAIVAAMKEELRAELEHTTDARAVTS